MRYPLSVAQEGAWVGHKTAPHGAASNIPLLSELAGELDEDALRRAIELVVARHDVLRTRYRVGKDGLRAYVYPPDDSTVMRTIDAPARAQQVIEEEVWRPFDLRNDPVFRCCLIRVSPRDHRFLLVVHQIAVDHTSLGLLTDEISRAYNAFRRGAEPALPPVVTQYGVFASWQSNWLNTDEVRGELGKWASELAVQPTKFDLPGDRQRPPARTGRGEVATGELAPAVVARLEKLAQARGVALFDLLAAAWQVVLARYSAQERFLLGTSLPARSQAGVERSIGLFCNQVPVVAGTTGDPTFAELAERVHRSVEHAAAHQHLPFTSVVNVIGLKFDPSRTPLTQVSFDLRDTAAWAPRLDGIEATDVFVEIAGARMDLALCCYTTDTGGLSAQAEFATDLFDNATIDRIVAAFVAVAVDAADNPERRLGDLDLLGMRERQRVTQEWNATLAPYADDTTLGAAFEEQVLRTPEATAVRFAEERLSYAQLNERANRLAHFLREHGVGPEVMVGLRLPRSLDLIVALLAVVKAGGTYVPLDLDDPIERHAFVLRDTDTRILITDEASRDHSPLAGTGRTVALDSEWPQIAAYSAENPPRAAAPLNLVYVIYTSGSTGMPKGVCITHRGLLNYVTACMRGYASAGDGGAPLFSSLAFDMVVPNIFTPLLMGQTLYVVPPCRQTEIGSYLLRGAPYSFIKMTPGHLALLHAQLKPEDASRLAPVLVVGADFFPAHLYTSWREVDRESRLLNEYGPTEITVANTFGEPDDTVVRSRGVVPIGRPMANTTAYVLDTRMEPVPVGVIGELYVGGDGVARGYWGQARLTAERFVPDPFAAAPGGRLYHTGDLVRYLPNGELMFVGRADDQVKVKGYRIEPREVEECLASHDDVEQAVVVVDIDAVGERRLVGYLRAREGAALPAAGELNAFCRQRLPRYMVPAVFARVDRMPLNANGKLDRTALPPLSESRIGPDGVRVAPRDDIERTVAAIWSELLGVDVGVADNYFDLGVHSVMALTALEKVNGTFGVEVSVGQLFDHPTAGELARVVKELLPAEGDAAQFS
ncbi:MAG TPA: amino acid adenylation domain-containing protein [Actinocrinis sp.]|uniref:non-ribosomal peptide synthetase n=1 Tax=Actinocrinis sp. TaxID=1920516 RepID=UPI002DDD58FE|nr:amino acid adenylation domain-containing protein [Actinocrinis sp.]HEV2344123.1 amino acid adenylation domain-containing protein [Actinocrinis sp.]